MANRYINATLRFFDKFSQPLEKASQKVQGATNKLMAHHKEFNDLGKKLERTGRSMTRTGKSMTRSVTVPIAGVVGASVRAGMAFDEQMSKVSAISGATGKDLEMLRDKAKEMGAKTKFSATESAQALEYMAMAGWKTNQMTAGLPGIMNLAAASGEDLAKVSDIVTDSLTAFGMGAEESSHFADVLAAASSNANTNVGLMGESFKYVAPLAGALKFSAEDTSTALGLMANSGIKASQAGTSMNAWLTRMAKPTKESEMAMAKLGLSMTDSHGKMKTLDQIMGETRKAFAGLTEEQKAQYAAQLAGQRGMPGLLAIVNSSTKDYNKFADAVHNTNNNAENMAKTMMKNGAGAFTILKSSMESAGIAISDRLAPYVVKIIGFFQKLVDKFNSLSPKTQDFIIKMGLMAATIGPGIAVVGKLVGTYGGLLRTLSKVGRAFDAATGPAQFFSTKFPLVSKGLKATKAALVGVDGHLTLTGLKTSKLGTTVSKVAARFPMLGKMGRFFASPWGLAIGAVGAGLVGLYRKNDDFRKSVDSSWKKIKAAVAPVGKSLMQTFSSIAASLAPVIKVIGKTFGQAIKAMANAITPIIQTVGPALAKIFRVIGNVVKMLAPIFSKVMAGAVKILSKVFNALGVVVRKLQPVFKAVFNAVGRVIKTVASVIGSVIKGIMKTFGGIIDFITGVFTGNWSKAWNGVKSIFKGIWDTFVGIVKAPLNLIIDAINWVIDGLNKISIDVPDWVPGIGGKTFGINISHISHLEKGTSHWGGGMALVGERGPEIVSLPRGSRVTPNRDSQKMMSKSIIVNKLADKIIVREEADIDRIATALARKLEDVAPNVV